MLASNFDQIIGSGAHSHHLGFKINVIILKSPNADAVVTIAMLTAFHLDMLCTNDAWMARRRMSPVSIPQ